MFPLDQQPRNTEHKIYAAPFGAVWNCLQVLLTKFHPRYAELTISKCWQPKNLGSFLVSVKGVGDRYCQNKGGLHNSSTVYFTVTPEGMRQRCYCKKPGAGFRGQSCSNFASDARSLTTAQLVTLFPGSTEAVQRQSKELTSALIGGHGAAGLGLAIRAAGALYNQANPQPSARPAAPSHPDDHLFADADAGAGGDHGYHDDHGEHGEHIDQGDNGDHEARAATLAVERMAGAGAGVLPQAAQLAYQIRGIVPSKSRDSPHIGSSAVIVPPPRLGAIGLIPGATARAPQGKGFNPLVAGGGVGKAPRISDERRMARINANAQYLHVLKQTRTLEAGNIGTQAGGGAARRQ